MLRKKIQIDTDDDILFTVAKEIYNLDCVYSSPDIKNNKFNRLKIYKSTICRIIKGFIKNTFKLEKPNKNKFLIITQTSDINLINKNDKKVYYDTKNGPILERIKKKYSVINLQLVNSSSTSSKMIKPSKDYIPFEYFIKET